MSEVNGLGIYLLSSLGFVFAALIEFAMIVIIHHKKKNRKITRPNKIGFQSSNLNSRYRKIALLKNGKGKYKMPKVVDEDRDKNQLQIEKDEMELSRKVDFAGFLVYVIGYVLFNIFYWIDMLSE